MVLWVRWPTLAAQRKVHVAVQVRAWAPEFWGQKCVLRVRDWPESERGVWCLVETAQYLHTPGPISIEGTSSCFFPGAEEPFSAPKFLEPRFRAVHRHRRHRVVALVDVEHLAA